MALFTRRKSVDKFVRELLNKRKSHVDIIHELLDEKYSPEEIARATKILSVDESRAHERYAQRAAPQVVAPPVQEAGITPEQRKAALTQLQVIYDSKHTLLSTIALAEQKRALARDAVSYLPQDSEANARFSQIEAEFKEHVEGLGINKSIPAELEQVDKVRAYLKTVEASTNEKTLEGFDKWYASAIERNKSWDMHLGQVSIMHKAFEHYAEMFDVIAQQSKAPKPERTAAPGRRATVASRTAAPVREKVTVSTAAMPSRTGVKPQRVADLEEGDIELEFDDEDLLEQFRRIVQVKQALVPRIAEVYRLAQETRMLVDARGSQEQKVEMSSLFVELVDNIEKLLSGFKKGQVDVKKSMQKLAEDAQRLAEFEENVRTKKVSKESRASLVAYLDYQRQYVPLSKIAPKDVTGWISYFQRVQTKLEALRLPLLATPAPELKQTIGDVIYQLTLLKGKLTAIVELPYPQTAKTISRGKVEVLARSAEECMVLWSRIITGLDKIMVLAKEAGHAELLRNLQVMLQKTLPQDHGKMEVLMTKILSSLGLAAEHALKAVKPLEMADEVNLGLEELHKVHKTFNDARPIAVLEGLRAVLAIHARTST